MQDETGAFPRWLSMARPVVEPTHPAKPLGVTRALIAFSKASYKGLLQAFGLLEREVGPVLPGALEGKVGDDVAIYLAYFGAPATGMLMEALIASGVDFVVQVGMAGSISPTCHIGDLILPTWGIREEGTSYHYLPPDVPCRVSERALAQLRRYLAGETYEEGGIWTTDAPYRETEDKVKAYAGQGVLAVEMECTALMAIAAVREVDFAAALVITDELFGEEWVQGFTSEAVMATGERLCQALARGFLEAPTQVASQPIPFFIDLEEAPAFSQMEGLETTVLTGRHGEQMMMALNTTLPGHTVPMHTHPHEQIGVVYSGRALLRIGEEEREVGPGDFYCIPGGVPHGDTTIGDEPFVMLDIFYPVRKGFLARLNLEGEKLGGDER